MKKETYVIHVPAFPDLWEDKIALESYGRSIMAEVIAKIGFEQVGEIRISSSENMFFNLDGDSPDPIKGMLRVAADFLVPDDFIPDHIQHLLGNES